MPKEITIMTYEIDELSDEAKEKALAWARKDLSFDDNDADMLTEAMIEGPMADAGVVGPELQWSLSCCQGDGVAFYGDVDIEKLKEKHPDVKTRLDELQKFDIVCVDIKIICTNYSYNHYNSMGVDIDHESIQLENDFDSTEAWQEAYRKVEDRVDTIVVELGKYILKVCQELSKKLEKMGYTEIESRSIDSYLIESIKVNEYHFTKEGNRLVAL